MNDIKEKTFDYSLVDEETAEYWQEIEKDIKDNNRTIKERVYDNGRKLNLAKRKAKKNNSYSREKFKMWCKSKLGFSLNYGEEMIKFYKEVKRDRLPQKVVEELPIEVVARYDSVPRALQDKVKNGEVEGKNEFYELKKQLENEKKQKEKLQKQVEKLKNQEPETETKIKEVEKEVIPDDYEDVKQKAERLEKAHDFMKEKKQDLEEQLQEAKKEKRETKKEVEDFQQLKNQVDKLRKRKDEIGMQVDSAANLSQWMMDIKKVLQNDLAPMKYSEDIANQAHDSIVMDNILDVVEQVEEWCYDMRDMIEESQNTINTEVINNE